MAAVGRKHSDENHISELASGVCLAENDHAITVLKDVAEKAAVEVHERHQ